MEKIEVYKCKGCGRLFEFESEPSQEIHSEEYCLEQMRKRQKEIEMLKARNLEAQKKCIDTAKHSRSLRVLLENDSEVDAGLVCRRIMRDQGYAPYCAENTINLMIKAVLGE